MRGWLGEAGRPAGRLGIAVEVKVGHGGGVGGYGRLHGGAGFVESVDECADAGVFSLRGESGGEGEEQRGEDGKAGTVIADKTHMKRLACEAAQAVGGVPHCF